MKKTLVLLLALTMIGLAGCGSPDAVATEDNRVVVDYEIDVPEGFEKVEIEGLDLYYANADVSNINMTIMEKTAADSVNSLSATILWRMI